MTSVVRDFANVHVKWHGCSVSSCSLQIKIVRDDDILTSPTLLDSFHDVIHHVAGYNFGQRVFHTTSRGLQAPLHTEKERQQFVSSGRTSAISELVHCDSPATNCQSVQ
jgi:hypothetical protein